MTRSPLELDHLVVARAPQGRLDGARLELYDDGGALGAFVETTPDELDGASVVRLDDADGAPVLSVLHPGRTAKARVDGPGGVAGFVSKVGRVRSNLALHGPGRRPEGEPIAVLHALHDGDGWAGVGATLRWWRMSEPSEDAYAEARYTLDLVPTVDAELRPLLLAAVVLVDRSVVQLVSA
jgi:hypothetical protein